MKKLTIGTQYYGNEHWDLWQPCYMISPKKNKVINVAFIPAQEKMMSLGYKRISVFSEYVKEYKSKVMHKKKAFISFCDEHNIPIPKDKQSGLWSWARLSCDSGSKYARRGRIGVKRRRR